MKECSATENILFDESKMEQQKKPHGNKGKARTDKQLDALRKGVDLMKQKRIENERKKEEDKQRRKAEMKTMKERRELMSDDEDDEEEVKVPLIPVEPPVPTPSPQAHTRELTPSSVPLQEFIEKKEQNYATKDDIQTLRQLLEQLKPIEKEVIKEVMVDRPVEKEVIKEKVVYLSGSQLLDKLFLSNPAETHTDRLRQMISRR